MNGSRELLLTINAEIDGCVTVTGNSGESVNLLPFHGTAESEYFTGRIMPSAADTQKCREGVCELSARYVLEGRDCMGEDCRIFIENNGTSTEGSAKTVPKAVTDSRALSRLMTAELLGEVTGTDKGVRVDIYERLSGFERKEHFFMLGTDTVYAELYIPDSVREGGKCPAVILAHGYNGNALGMRGYAERLAGRGIGVYCFDFRGGSPDSNSSGSTEQMSVSSEILDLTAAIADAQKLPWVDGERLFLAGESQGGFVTALTAPTLETPPAGVFLIYPAFCIPDDWRWALEDENALRHPTDFNGMTIGRAYIDGLPRYDVYERAAGYKGRTVIFHGDEDGVVDIEYSKRLAERMDNAELFVFPAQGHGFSERFKTVTACRMADEISHISER